MGNTTLPPLPSTALQMATDAWSTSPEALTPLKAFENHIFRLPNGRGVLRLTHVLHREEAQLSSELDFVAFLGRRGASVAAPILSKAGHLVLACTDGWFASAFALAPGHPPSKSLWGSCVFEPWGRCLALMHLHSRDYTPGPGIQTRGQWFEEPDHTQSAHFLPATDTSILAIHKANLKEAKSAIETIGETILIHTDLHQMNFHVDGDRVIAFDFDDCAYHTPMADLAIAYYHAARAPWIQGANGLPDPDACKALWDGLTKGYGSITKIPETWFKAVAPLLRMRMSTLYIACHRAGDPENDPTLAQKLVQTRAMLLEGQLSVPVPCG